MNSPTVCSQTTCYPKTCDSCFGVPLPQSMQKTHVVRTPYYREIIEGQLLEAQPIAYQNFTDYNIFCLTTRLHPYIKEFSKEAYVVLSSYEYEEAVYFFVDIKIGDNYVSLNEEQAKRLQDAVVEITTENPNYTLLYYLGIGLPNKKNVIEDCPESWINDIIKFTLSTQGYDSFYKDGKFYLDLSDVDDYYNVFYELQDSLIDELRSLYFSGVLLFDITDKQTEEFVKKFSLTIYARTELENFNLYAPNWRNDLFAPNMFKFLTQRLLGDNKVSFPVASKLMQRHKVASYLSGFLDDFYFTMKYVYFDADDLDKIRKITDGISVALNGFLKKVMIKRFNSKKEAEDFANEAKKVLKDVVIYRTDESLPYTVSLASSSSEIMENIG